MKDNRIPSPVETHCLACGSTSTDPFHEMSSVPVQDVVRLHSRDEARAIVRGDIRLCYCRACGFIWNAAFQPELVNYSALCEESQGFSAVFRQFQDGIVRDLVERHHLFGKTILEIGCGKGDFLVALCRSGGNRGLGFDPAFVPERNPARAGEDVSFFPEVFSERHSGVQADFICCKMSLEHVGDPAGLLRVVRSTLLPGRKAAIWFQVPDAVRVLRECAFWDIYYEHCCYFSTGSLTRLFRRSGFAVTRVEKNYGGQYVVLEACAANGNGHRVLDGLEEPAELALLVEQFVATCRLKIAQWRETVLASRYGGRPVVLWGGGSKAVGFLSALALDESIACVVDINPHKHGTFVPGTGHEIVAPQRLRDICPGTVILMNPVYRAEVASELSSLGLKPEILTV